MHVPLGPLFALTTMLTPALAATDAGNPLLQTWKTPFGAPPFQAIQNDHFLPAFREGISRENRETAAIATSKEAPTFANTIAALDQSGQLLSKVNMVFSCLSGAETNERLQQIEAESAPLLSSHADDILLNEGLFQRVKVLYDKRASLGLDPEQTRLLEHTYRSFVRGGANLNASQKERLRAINNDLATLTVKFGEQLLKETNAWRLVVDRKEDLKGLPESQISAASEAAAQAGLAGKWIFTLKAPSIWPFLQSAESRELRKRILEGYLNRCQSGPNANGPVFARIASLRAEKAQLLGYKTFAAFSLEETMTKTPERAYQLMNQIWGPAQEAARREATDLQAMIRTEGGTFELQPWDWRFYATKVQKARYDLDEEALRPYFPLERVREGAFTVAHKLYGITFTERKDIPTWHPEVKVFEVKDKDGSHLGLFYCDYHPRPGKRGGAWCSSLRDAWQDGDNFVTPLVFNVGNFARPTGDAPALLNLEEVETLFHEFGHALHALFAHYRYHGSGNVPNDFVELPSQIMENWAVEPEVLKLYARQWKTGAAMPEELIARIRKASKFNQGFATTEYLAAALLDMDWHSLTDTKQRDASTFEQASLAKWGLIPQIPPRYRTPYFMHAAEDYAAGYYSYIWSAVLDSDAFQAFKEKGDLFDPTCAKAFRQLLSKGGSEDPMALFVAFRGREPKVEPLLEKRGLK